MNAPRYQVGERVRVIVEGPVVHHALCESPYPSELTVAVPMDGGTYQVTVPLLGTVTIERLTPTVLPREIWEDRDGDPWFAICVLGFDTPRTMMLPGELHDLKGVGDSMLSPEDVDRRYGPITRVYPLPAVADAPQPEADEPRAPRLMRGDVWGDGDGDEWKVVEQDGRLLLTWDGETRTWESADSLYGPLTLIERAGHRRTEDTVPVWQLKLGQVVSHPDWCDGAPVRFFEALGDVRDLKITCRPLGWISKITFPAARDAEVTLWDEIAGGAR